MCVPLTFVGHTRGSFGESALLMLGLECRWGIVPSRNSSGMWGSEGLKCGMDQILKGDMGSVALGDSYCGTLRAWKGDILIGSCSELRCESALPQGMRNPWWLGLVPLE